MLGTTPRRGPTWSSGRGSTEAAATEALRMAPEGAPQAPTSEAPLVVEPQAAPATEPAMVPERVPAAGGAASGEHALVLR